MQITVKHKGKDVVLNATAEQQALLADSENEITSLINSWDDVLKRVTLEQGEHFILAYEGKNPRLIATKAELMLRILCAVINEGWVWEPGQPGWLPYFNLQAGGFAFSSSGYVFWFSAADVGSRRCLKSEKLSDFCAKKFPTIFKLIILNHE